MNKEDLRRKVGQIEEQAAEILNGFPKNLTKERVRMIFALARYIRTDLDHSQSIGIFDEKQLSGDPEDTVIRGDA